MVDIEILCVLSRIFTILCNPLEVRVLVKTVEVMFTAEVLECFSGVLKMRIMVKV